ncbi:hypothetical protein [Actinomycetospora cinnamomea]|uniref:Secreted protein n=1 Tax=Actinomycetospora cinnamomea TaxID=663609 RepID=A0A2U1FI18_9PSEU|nr:hypothetical protein [Actinomycetospora cinnamomea]PVZ11822.1 hypothetical protein C8D89_103152 [Actinomycetospora cinnamomea]
MKRLFWVGVGVAVGVTATRKVNELTQKATPAGLGTSLGEGLRELGAGLGAFGAEVRAGMNERAEELYAMVEDTTEIPVRPDPSPARHARAPRRGASHAR